MVLPRRWDQGLTLNVPLGCAHTPLIHRSYKKSVGGPVGLAGQLAGSAGQPSPARSVGPAGQPLQMHACPGSYITRGGRRRRRRREGEEEGGGEGGGMAHMSIAVRQKQQIACWRMSSGSGTAEAMTRYYWTNLTKNTKRLTKRLQQILKWLQKVSKCSHRP